MRRSGRAAAAAGQVRRSGQLSLLGRFGEPREVAQASHDQSSYLTGTVQHVDAGYVDAQ